MLGGLLQNYLDPKVQREQWRQAVDYVEKESTAKSIALFVFPTPFAPFVWYQKGVVEGKGIAPSFIINNEDLARLPGKIYDKDKIFFFQYLTGLTDPESKTLNELAKLEYRQKKIINFEGVGFIYIMER